jgi:peptide/nickel transport system permease protein
LLSTSMNQEKIQPRKSQWQLTRFRLWRNRMALVGLFIIAAFLFTALLAPLFAPYDPLKQDLLSIRAGISSKHWLGCDQVGRDVLSRILFGTSVTLKIALTSVLIALILGTAIGSIGGYYGGKADAGIVFLTDVLLAFPGLLLAIAIVAAVGTGLTSVILAAGFSSVPGFIRITRGVVMGEKERDYVLAARAIGESNLSIIIRYILPNCLAPIVVLLTLRLATIILTTSGLSFLGLGVQPPTPEWGAMLAEGRGYFQQAPHIAMFPGLAIMMVVLGFNLLGDGLRDALDPRMKI